MKKLLFFLLVFCIFANFSFAVSANLKSKSDEVLDKVQRNYKSIKTIDAKFSQISSSEALGEEEKSSGKFKALIPNNIKVEYTTPREQVYLIKKEGLTFLNKEDRQVVKDSADSVLNSKIPLTFLAGIGDVRKDFSVTNIIDKDGSYQLDLEPKEEGEMENLILWINKKNLLVNKIFVKELGGNTISFELSGIILNKNVNNNDFNISIPDGYDLIDNRK